MSETLGPSRWNWINGSRPSGCWRRQKNQGVELAGPNGFLNESTKNLLETGACGDDRAPGLLRARPGWARQGNSRNGTRAKTVLPEIGPVKIAAPPDTNSSFEPQIVKRSASVDGDR